MAVERVTERPDGSRVVERHETTSPAYVERRSGGGMGGVLIGIAVLALVAIVAFFLLSMNRQEAIETQAITGAAESVADSAAGAAESIGGAADRAADAVNPN